MPIAILGTGRSGTSLVARMLNLCGLYMGEQEGLWDPRSALAMNPTGYWEHRDIHTLMDRLFEHLGGTWENPPTLPDGWECDASVAPFLDEAHTLVAGLFRGHAEWAFKLPKATVTIAFWRRVVPRLRFVLCVRNPLDFARSLGSYSEVSRSHLFAMWQFYNYSLLAATQPHERFVTFYEDYFPDYRPALAPLLDYAGLPRPVPGDDVDRCIAGFHDRGLKHYTSTLEDVLADDEVPYMTRQLYLDLLDGGTHACDLPILGYRDLLLPLLQRALVGEGVLDGSGAVTSARYEALQQEREGWERRAEEYKAREREARSAWRRWPAGLLAGLRRSA